jgi:hypothetical protein
MKKILILTLFLMNSICYCFAGGKLEVSVDSEEYGAGETIRITLSNQCDYRVGADYLPYGLDFVVVREGEGDNFEGVISKKKCLPPECFDDRMMGQWLEPGEKIEFDWKPFKREMNKGTNEELLPAGTYKVGIKYPGPETAEGIREKIAFSQSFKIVE